MSPISHGIIGWVISTPLKSRRDRRIVTFSALLPDLDGIAVVFGEEWYEKIHHTFGHCLLFAFFFAIAGFLLGQDKTKAAVLAFIGVHSHILGDLLGSGFGWGLPYFWPVSHHKFEFAPPFQWEISSWQNILITIFFMFWVVREALVNKRTCMEVFSVKYDQQVVAVFNKWAGKT